MEAGFTSVTLCANCKYSYTRSDTTHASINAFDNSRDDVLPSSCDIVAIDDFCERAQIELDRYDEEITRLEAALTALKTGRQRLQTEVDLHKALPAPVRRLPSDVLGVIFEHVSSSNLDSLPTTRPSSGWGWMAPLNLSHVCHYWRTVCLSFPTLWRYVVVVTGRPRERDKVPIKLPFDRSSRLDAFLRRSQSCSLIIRIENPFVTLQGTRFVKVLKPLANPKHKQRFQCVDVHGYSALPFQETHCHTISSVTFHRSPTADPAPGSIDLFGALYEDYGGVDMGVSSILRCQTLRRVHLSPGTLYCIRLHASYSHITHLTITVDEHAQHIRLLQRLPNLVYLNACCRDPCHDHPSFYEMVDYPCSFDPVPLPLLQSLILRSQSSHDSTDCLTSMLTEISAPGLCGLAISVDHSSQWSEEAFASSIGPAKYSLQSLKLAGLCLAPHQLVAMLNILSNVRTLDLSDQGRWDSKCHWISEELLQPLIVTSADGDVILPRLQKLYLTGSRDEPSDAAFVRTAITLVQSRRLSIDHFRLIVGNGSLNDPLPVDLDESIAGLRKQGVRIQVCEFSDVCLDWPETLAIQN